MTLSQILGAGATLFVLWAMGEGLRRLFLHPLSHVPGPRLAALTWWYEYYYDGVLGGQYVFKIQELHKIYGPIIRITPDELHVNDVGFLETVYAPSSSRRDKYSHQLKTLRVPGSVGITVDSEVHRLRRGSLAPFFSKRNVTALEHLIKAKVDQLVGVIAAHAVAETPVNLSDVFFGFANDVVTNFVFAQEVDVLADQEASARLRKNGQELLLGINTNKHFAWIPDFLESLPLSISKPIMPAGLIDMLEIFDKVRIELLSIIEARASGEKLQELSRPTEKQSIFDSILDNTSLPAAERTVPRLVEEGALLVLAGTESPAASLKFIMYYLVAKRAIFSTLRAELATVSREASWAQLEQLPYLSAVIEEGNRLSFGVTARLARVAHEPLTYTPSKYSTCSAAEFSKSYAIPAGTPVSITTLSSHTSETVFPDPYVFNPDRWLGEEGNDRRRFQMAFNKGGRKCLGFELARAELYLATAALVRGFDMAFWKTDESDVAFVHDYHIAKPKLDSKGVQVMAKLV